MKTFFIALFVLGATIGPAKALDLWEIHLEGPQDDLSSPVDQILEVNLDPVTPPNNACGIRFESIAAYNWATFTSQGSDLVLPGENGTPNIQNPQQIEVRRIPWLGETCGNQGLDVSEVLIDGTMVDAAQNGIGHLIVQAGIRTFLTASNEPIVFPSCGFADCVAPNVNDFLSPSHPDPWWLDFTRSVLLAQQLDADLGTVSEDKPVSIRDALRFAHVAARLAAATNKTALSALVSHGRSETPEPARLAAVARYASNCARALQNVGRIAPECRAATSSLLKIAKGQRLALQATLSAEQ